MLNVLIIYFQNGHACSVGRQCPKSYDTRGKRQVPNRAGWCDTSTSGRGLTGYLDIRERVGVIRRHPGAGWYDTSISGSGLMGTVTPWYNMKTFLPTPIIACSMPPRARSCRSRDVAWSRVRRCRLPSPASRSPRRCCCHSTPAVRPVTEEVLQPYIERRERLLNRKRRFLVIQVQHALYATTGTLTVTFKWNFSKFDLVKPCPELLTQISKFSWYCCNDVTFKRRWLRPVKFNDDSRHYL